MSIASTDYAAFLEEVYQMKTLLQVRDGQISIIMGQFRIIPAILLPEVRVDMCWWIRPGKGDKILCTPALQSCLPSRPDPSTYPTPVTTLPCLVPSLLALACSPPAPALHSASLPLSCGLWSSCWCCNQVLPSLVLRQFHMLCQFHSSICQDRI